ncbi:MAG TPA: transcription antitermination factor NusB [Fibrobacteria bacterium]|nr:transcription antitermination factor NusB [Fibrobacteria bacterium]
MISRRRGREFAMQLLYAVEVGKEAFAEALKGLSADPDLPEDAREYGVKLARKVLENQEALDAKLALASANWDLERIAIVDKLIIRCAMAELMFFPDVPLKVAINEAVDIAKKFSTGESSRFVNGVLDAIAKTFSNSIQRNEQDAE